MIEAAPFSRCITVICEMDGCIYQSKHMEESSLDISFDRFIVYVRGEFFVLEHIYVFVCIFKCKIFVTI